MQNKVWTMVMVATLFYLAPSNVWANGWGAVEACVNASLWGAGVGCLVGLVVALTLKAKTGGLFGWTIGGGMALGFGGLLITVVVTSPSNPDFIGFAILSVVLAGLVAGIGGAILAMLALAIRRSTGNQSSPTQARPPVIKKDEN